MKNLAFTFSFLISLMALGQSSQQTQYAAYLTSSKTMWEKSIEQAKNQYGESSLETGIAMYGLLNNTMAAEDEQTFKAYKDDTIDLLKELIDANPSAGEPRAVLSSVYGLVMAYSPWKGMYLGMKSSSLMEEAIKLEPESALVQKLYAGSKLYTPETFGGDPKIALEAYVKSLDLYEEDEKAENWLYLDTMMGMALAYRKTEQPEKATETLERAVSLEPQYYWAKSVLEKWSKS